MDGQQSTERTKKTEGTTRKGIPENENLQKKAEQKVRIF